MDDPPDDTGVEVVEVRTITTVPRLASLRSVVALPTMWILSRRVYLL